MAAMDRKRKLLTLEERIQVINENGISMKKLSEEYGCGTTQILM